LHPEDYCVRYLVIAAAVLVAIVLIVLLVGWSLPVQHRATSESHAQSVTPIGLLADIPPRTYFEKARGS
jgi:hypothetical protein